MQLRYQFNLGNIHAVAAECLQTLVSKPVWLFHGAMGAGKTTFIHALCDVLEVKDAVSSPTFSIINEYKTGQGDTVYHLDLYRLADAEEAVQAGVEDVWYSGKLSFTEWPEKAADLLPADAVHFHLSPLDAQTRLLTIDFSAL